MGASLADACRKKRKGILLIMERTHIRAHILLLLAGLVLLLNGCAPSSQVPPSALPSPSAAVSERAERPTPPPPTAQPSEAEPEEPTEPVVIAEPEDIQEVLYESTRISMKIPIIPKREKVRTAKAPRAAKAARKAPKQPTAAPTAALTCQTRNIRR